ncbi:hypothetical protein A1C_00175 [Rickettsia akari str. Hartford]|uniref:Uncharacterized protein n=1 Tax=Rickettsia akari (strain Hartford) TaxID=293614 RepID=A8GLU5_RICAH|nr:hypothetical protein [Rickettsia akari]ABV74370.1 hypothetical protein A1C_00175 [Rickettsia akari str. Hartford]
MAIVDSTIAEKHLLQILNDNHNETQPTQTLLNQNSFEITESIEHNKAEKQYNDVEKRRSKRGIRSRNGQFYIRYARG